LPDESTALCAAIFGCAGLRLSERERRFFRAANPAGFILFGRNCESPRQVRDLVKEMRGCVGRGDAPVLIDQEGGRVARLQPPHWRRHPSARQLGRLAERDLAVGTEAARLNYRLLGLALAALGVSVDCVPVLDLLLPETHAVIGDRAFSADPAIVAALGRAAADGLLSAGVVPVAKHIPGHGRAAADSHHELPRVGASRRDLEETDFVPFARLADLPVAMTAHVVYEALDPNDPATVSRRVIEDVVRGAIGFQGLLLSDDLSMDALSGGLAERARRAVGAGCDIVLHCNARMSEMTAVADGAGALSEAGHSRLKAALESPAKPAEGVAAAALARRLDAMLQDT
jgi:beta-N-acetylhexosaminidase